MDFPAPAVSVAPRLAAETIRRLCISLILAEMADLVLKGQIQRAAMEPLLDSGRSSAEIDKLRIDEEGLGFDSLARLSLILRVNRFFNLSATGIEDYLLMHRALGEWIALIGQHLDMVAAEAVFTFDTSGSAGPVKHVAHRALVLQDEVRAHLRGPLSDLPSGAQIIALVPPHHIYGFLFTCLLPALLGSQIIDLHRAAPTAVFRHVRAGDLIVGTPLHWGLLQRTGIRLPEGVLGLTSAGPSTEETWRASAMIGLTRLTEVYGATETGGLGTRGAMQAPFQLLDNLRRSGEAIPAPSRDGVTLDVQDKLEWLGPDLFRVLGRKDDVIQVAGVNVSPGEIRKALLACDGVADIAIRPDATRLKAFVVPNADQSDLTAFEAALRRYIQLNLPAPARPTAICFGPALPRNSMGKLCDWQIPTGGT